MDCLLKKDVACGRKIFGYCARILVNFVSNGDPLFPNIWSPNYRIFQTTQYWFKIFHTMNDNRIHNDFLTALLLRDAHLMHLKSSIFVLLLRAAFPQRGIWSRWLSSSSKILLSILLRVSGRLQQSFGGSVVKITRYFDFKSASTKWTQIVLEGIFKFMV